MGPSVGGEDMVSVTGDEMDEWTPFSSPPGLPTKQVTWTARSTAASASATINKGMCIGTKSMKQVGIGTAMIQQYKDVWRWEWGCFQGTQHSDIE